MLRRRHNSFFTKFAKWTSRVTGQPIAFAVAMGTLVLWACSGPIFGFSDTWQLIINTGTTIVTFLMVFLIQNTQNRDSEALHVKLDELIRSTRGANNQLLDLEELEVEELDAVEFTPGPQIPGGGDPRLYPMYRKIKEAGKSVQAVWMKAKDVEPLLDAVGPAGMYLEVDVADLAEAEELERVVARYRR